MAMLETKSCCPHCGGELHRKPYLMAVDPDAPGLIDLLSGKGGERARIFTTVAVCLLVVLILTGLRAALGI